jgi:hypothetical protein
MDKIEKYKNLNETVNKFLKKEFAQDLQEEYKFVAQELVENLEDPNKVNMLLRTGLVDPARLSRVRTALKDPEKAIKNTSVRSDLINMLMSLINIITTDPTVFQKVRKTAKGKAVKGGDMDMAESVIKEEEKWIQKAINRPGALRKKLGVEKGKKIPTGELEDISAELSAEAEGEKKLSKADLTTLRQVNLAKTLKSFK